jgi:hypothetical protein
LHVATTGHSRNAGVLKQTPEAATTEYEPDYGRVVSIREFDRPSDSDELSTAQTIETMDRLAHRDSRDPIIIDAAAGALEDAGMDETAKPCDKARALFWFLKRAVKFVRTPGTSPLVDQTLIPPATLLSMPEPHGDCPQYSMAACALFAVLGMQTKFKTIAADDSAPNVYSHVYNIVEISPTAFMPFDASNGPAPGAEYARPFKARVWPPRLTMHKETSVHA